MRPRVLGILLGVALVLLPYHVVAHASKGNRTTTRAAKPAPAAEKETAPVPDPVPPAAQPSTAAAAPAVAPASPAPVAAPAAATPAPILAEPSPAKSTSTPSFLSAGGTLLLGSLVLVGLLYGASRLMRRLPIGRLLPSADGPIRVIARTHLGTRESLCLIEVGPSTLLVAITQQSIQTLHVWPDGVRAAAPTPPGSPGSPRPSAPGQLRSLAARLSGRQ